MLRTASALKRIGVRWAPQNALSLDISGTLRVIALNFFDRRPYRKLLARYSCDFFHRLSSLLLYQESASMEKTVI